MGQVIEYHSAREREEYTAFVGMVVFLGGWALLFTGFLMAYALLRMRAVHWPPLREPPLPLSAAAVLTTILAASNLNLRQGQRALVAGNQREAANWVATATAFGAVFATGQVAIGASLAVKGMSLTSSPFGSLFYVLSGIHLVHAVVGLGLLVWITCRLYCGLTNPARYLALRLWALYWQFVTATWLVLFLAIYVV